MIERHFYTTKEINEAITSSESMAEAVEQAIEQFNINEWGKVPEQDKEANKADLKAGCGHILGRYETPQGDIYIDMALDPEQAEAVIMFCNEY